MTSDQLSLLDEPRAPYQRRSPASRDGAIAAAPCLNDQLRRVLAAYRTAGGRGLTDRELSEATGLPLHVCPARRGELAKRGLVTRKAVGRRLSSTGVRVGFWTETENGRAR